MTNTEQNFEIKLPQFEGPFDLLLFFIESDYYTTLINIELIPNKIIINDVTINIIKKIMKKRIRNYR